MTDYKTPIEDLLRSMFTADAVRQRALSGHALLSMLEIDTEFGGNCMRRRLTRKSDVLAHRGRDYEHVELSTQMLESVRGDPDWRTKAIRETIDDGIEELGARMSANLFAERPQTRNYEGHTFTDSAVASLPMWHPREVTAADNFMGLCRNGQKGVRGIVMAASGCSETEAIQYAEGKARAVDPLCDGFYVMNPERHERVLEQWRPHATPSLVRPGATIFYNGGPGRAYLVVPDTDCPFDEAWRIPNGAMTLASAGPCPTILDLADGLKVVAIKYDGFRLTVGGHYNIICDEPGKFVRILWK